MYKFGLCDDPWDNEELGAIVDVVRSGRYTMNGKVREFQKQFANHYGAKYAVMVNSGSSANLVAIAALVTSGRLSLGSEVIVPAVSWSTTFFPLQQYGMKLVFVDINPETLNIDVEKFKAAITPNTKMFFAVNLLGNPNEYDEIEKICYENKILLVEDNCESLGGKYKGRNLGTFGLLGTFSTFYSHHMVTMEGGMILTDDQELYEYMIAIRAHGWTRDIPEDAIIYKKNPEPFYENFNFIVPGYNVRPIEMEGAIGLVQMKKIDGFIEQRRKNAAYFKEKLSKYEDIQIQKEISESSWFGFAVILKGKLEGKRDVLVNKLRESDIEVRPIVAGNFTRNYVIKYFNFEIFGDLKNADYVHDNGFFIGNHSSDNHELIDYFCEVLDKAISEI